MEYKSVIFDFNGTLFKDSHYHTLAWLKIAYEVTGIKFTEEYIENYAHGSRNIDTLRNLFKLDLPDEELEKLSQKKEAYYRQLVNEDNKNAKLVKGATDLFDKLKNNNIPFTIASASIPENIDFFFHFFSLDRWFNRDYIICDDGTFNSKVDMYHAASKLLNLNKEETTVFEDTSIGYQCAIDAGFTKIILINDTIEKMQERCSWEYVCASILDFTEI